MYRNMSWRKPFDGNWYWKRIPDEREYKFEQVEGEYGEDHPQLGFETWAGGWKDYHDYLKNEIIMEDHEKSPEKLAEEQFTQQEVRRAILQLSEDQQQVVLMSFIEGFEYSEIAAALNKSEGNIRVIVHRALKRMREIIDNRELNWKR